MAKGVQDSRHQADGHRRVTGSALRASWLSNSLDRGWPDPLGWRTPAVDRVVEAVIDADGSVGRLEHALRALAWERASETLHLDTALDDLDALWSVLEAGRRRQPISVRQARRLLVDAWVDALAVDRGVPCIDPLSGLHTAGYLLGRVRELDRLAGGEPAALALLSMRWRRPAGPWRRIGTVVSATAILLENVRPDATFAQDGTYAALALVPDDLRARVERSCLARECASPVLHEANARADLIVLPDDRDRVPAVLRRLRLPAEHPESRITPDTRD
ncbi:MAG TPA: hypothetical protein VIQ02_10435 [Jiangellaceae bacterium]